MIDQVLRLLGYGFVQNALAAGVVIAVVSGVVSRFVVARNQSFAVHALVEHRPPALPRSGTRIQA